MISQSQQPLFPLATHPRARRASLGAHLLWVRHVSIFPNVYLTLCATDDLTPRWKKAIIDFHLRASSHRVARKGIPESRTPGSSASLVHSRRNLHSIPDSGVRARPSGAGTTWIMADRLASLPLHRSFHIFGCSYLSPLSFACLVCVSLRNFHQWLCASPSLWSANSSHLLSDEHLQPCCPK